MQTVQLTALPRRAPLQPVDTVGVVLLGVANHGTQQDSAAHIAWREGALADAQGAVRAIGGAGRA